MPYKRKYKKKVYRKKRKYTKKRQMPIIRVKDGLIPANRLYSVRYCDTVSLNPGLGGAIATHLWRANHIYDVDASFGGHSPLGSTTLATLYNHYTVVGSKIHVKWQTVGASDNYECGVYLSDDATLITDVNRIRESGRGRVTYIAGASKQLGNTTAKYSAKKFMGLGKGVLGSSKVWGTFGSAPGSEFDASYYHMWVHGAGDIDEAPIYAHVTIDYILKLKEPKILNSS